MPRRYALSTLRTRCQRRADAENDSHISNAEWAALISEAYGELFEVVAGAGLRYFETVHEFTADGSPSYDEPDDHGKTIGLDLVYTDGRRRALRPMMAQERQRYGSSTGGEPCEYALVDDQIVIYPDPASGLTFELLYIPQPPDVSDYDDADELDVVCIHGESFLIWSVTVKALSKSESDVRLAMAERDRAGQKLLEWAIERDANEPRRRYFDLDDHDTENIWRSRPT